MSGKYSLEALRTLRAAREEALDLELAQRRRESERRALAARETADELERMGAERQRTRALEGEALASDAGLSAADLVRGLEREAAQIAIEARQLGRVQASQAELQTAIAERERVAAELRGAQAEREAVDRHRERWRRERARKAEVSEDESATERWNAEHFGPGRS